MLVMPGARAGPGGGARAERSESEDTQRSAGPQRPLRRGEPGPGQCSGQTTSMPVIPMRLRRSAAQLRRDRASVSAAQVVGLEPWRVWTFTRFLRVVPDDAGVVVVRPAQVPGVDVVGAAVDGAAGAEWVLTPPGLVVGTAQVTPNGATMAASDVAQRRVGPRRVDDIAMVAPALIVGSA